MNKLVNELMNDASYYNIIEEDAETIKGTKKDIVNYFIHNIKYEINILEEIGQEWFITLLKLKADLLEEIQDLEDSTLLKVEYLAMGCFRYTIIETLEETEN